MVSGLLRGPRGASIGASATAGFPTRTGRASRGLSRLGRAVTWRRDTSFARRALSSFDGHGRNAASRDSVGGRNIANHALSVPPQEVTEEDADSEDYDPGGGREHFTVQRRHVNVAPVLDERKHESGETSGGARYGRDVPGRDRWDQSWQHVEKDASRNS